MTNDILMFDNFSYHVQENTRTVRKSDYTPASALRKHIASVFDEKCRERKR